MIVKFSSSPHPATPGLGSNGEPFISNKSVKIDS